MYRHSNTTLLKMVFIEDLDYIVAASEDNSICMYVYVCDCACVCL